MTIGMTGAFLIFGIVISLLINRSITHPLSLLEKKDQGNWEREILKGISLSSLHRS